MEQKAPGLSLEKQRKKRMGRFKPGKYVGETGGTMLGRISSHWTGKMHDDRNERRGSKFHREEVRSFLFVQLMAQKEGATAANRVAAETILIDFFSARLNTKQTATRKQKGARFSNVMKTAIIRPGGPRPFKKTRLRKAGRPFEVAVTPAGAAYDTLNTRNLDKKIERKAMLVVKLSKTVGGVAKTYAAQVKSMANAKFFDLDRYARGTLNAGKYYVFRTNTDDIRGTKLRMKHITMRVYDIPVALFLGVLRVYKSNVFPKKNRRSWKKEREVHILRFVKKKKKKLGEWRASMPRLHDRLADGGGEEMQCDCERLGRKYPHLPQVRGHICADLRTARILNRRDSVVMEDWNASGTFAPSYGEVRESIAKAVLVIGRKNGGMRYRGAGFEADIQELARRARNWQEDSNFISTADLSDEFHDLRANLVCDVVDKSRSFSFVCPCIIAALNRKHLTGGDYDRLHGYKSLTSRDIITKMKTGQSKFFEHGKGRTNVKKGKSHRLAFLRILIKDRWFAAAKARSSEDFGEIAYRPITSYAGHIHKGLFRVVARIIEHLTVPFKDTYFSTVEEIKDTLDELNDNRARQIAGAEGEDTKMLEIGGGDIKDFFTRMDRSLALDFIRRRIAVLKEGGARFFAVERCGRLAERVEVHKNRERWLQRRPASSCITAETKNATRYGELCRKKFHTTALPRSGEENQDTEHA
eukprot:g19933.t1